MHVKLCISLFVLLIATACGGPQYPFDTGFSDSSEMSQEFAEGQREIEGMRDYDPGAAEADRERQELEQQERWQKLDAMADEEMGFTSSSGGCPDGCTIHKSGCDIKGNISINTGEKIYHVPGQNFYNDTVISAAQGERWFCTESEARANGWRKAKN